MKARDSVKVSDIIIVMEDLNAKVGNGPYGLGERNANGDSWVDWCTANGHCIMNT